MTEAQLYLAIALPCLTLLAGLWLGHSRLNDVRDLLCAELRTSRADSKADLTGLRSDIRGLRGDLEAIMGKLEELDGRLSRWV